MSEPHDPKFIGKRIVHADSTFITKKDDCRLEFFARERVAGDPECARELDELHKKLQGKEDADKYRDIHAVAYQDATTHGYTCIPVLQHLWGLPLTDLIMAYVHALRPSAIRITAGVQTLDAYRWRVTITVSDKDVVEEIHQEVEIAYGTGHDVAQCLEFARSGREPQASSGVYGNTSALLKAEF